MNCLNCSTVISNSFLIRFWGALSLVFLTMSRRCDECVIESHYSFCISVNITSLSVNITSLRYMQIFHYIICTGVTNSIPNLKTLKDWVSENTQASTNLQLLLWTSLIWRLTVLIKLRFTVMITCLSIAVQACFSI